MPGPSRTSSGFSTNGEAPDIPGKDDIIAPLRGKVFGVLVCAATFYEENVLLLRRSLEEKFMPGAWSLPAGKIQPNEGSLESAVLRELEEESGIAGTVRRSLGMTWFESVYYHQPLDHIQFDFLVTTDSPEVKLGDGSNMDHRWIPIDRAGRPPVPIDDFTGSLLAKAVRHYVANRDSFTD